MGECRLYRTVRMEIVSYCTDGTKYTDQSEVDLLDTTSFLGLRSSYTINIFVINAGWRKRKRRST